MQGLDLGDFSDLGFVNIFIFNAPVYGDIYGVADGILCANGDLDNCQQIEGTTTDTGPVEVVNPEQVEALTPAESTLGYFFTPLDDQLCRDNFLTLEAWYRESITGDDDRATLDRLHTQILDAFTKVNMSFVDNRDFLDWALIYNY